MLMNLTNVGCLDWDWVQSGVTIGVQNVDTDDGSSWREGKKVKLVKQPELYGVKKAMLLFGDVFYSF